VSLHEERWGKLFPDSNRARTVLDALVAEAAARGVTFKIGVRVQALARAPGGFRLETTGGTLEARAVVLATGGRSLPRTGSDGHGYVLAQRLGHSLVPTTPALVPLLLDDDLHEGLAGVAVDVALALAAPSARRRVFEGPLLWTHHGVSGPAVLDASRHLLRHRLEGRAPQLAARLVPGDFERVEAWLLGASRARPRANVATVLAEQVPVTLAARIAGRVGAEAHTLATLPRDVRRAVVHGLVALPLAVRDSRGYDHAEVTAGGIALAEIDPATMQSRLCPGLFLVGEILDVDGRLGGFNFQWAWASARAAAYGLRRFGSG
jgi:predicted Rossmann fold flavoprotein